MGSCDYVRTLMLSREEALVHTTAHEIRHVWQDVIEPIWDDLEVDEREGLKEFPGSGSDRDADMYAIRKQREWRRLHTTDVYPTQPDLIPQLPIQQIADHDCQCRKESKMTMTDKRSCDCCGDNTDPKDLIVHMSGEDADKCHSNSHLLDAICTKIEEHDLSQHENDVDCSLCSIADLLVDNKLLDNGDKEMEKGYLARKVTQG